VITYGERLTQRLVDVLGDDLVAVYLHGSAVLGGWRSDRSDVDVLAVTAGSIDSGRLERLAATVSHRALAAPGVGLELDVITQAAAAEPRQPSPFELNLATGPDGDSAMLGAGHPGNTDVILFLAVVRASGHALFGPPPTDIVGRVPRARLLTGFARELDWATANGSTAYQALNAARVWRHAEQGVICSKLDGARWALGRGHDGALVDAIAFQEGRSDRLPEPAATAALVAHSQAISRAAAS
jgi:streptomycin 3"-adenylyltransferase